MITHWTLIPDDGAERAGLFVGLSHEAVTMAAMHLRPLCAGSLEVKKDGKILLPSQARLHLR